MNLEWEVAKSKQIQKLIAIEDSDLIVSEVKGFFDTKREGLIPYKGRVSKIIESFKYFSITVVPRNDNQLANTLVVATSSEQIIDREIFKCGRCVINTMCCLVVLDYSKY